MAAAPQEGNNRYPGRKASAAKFAVQGAYSQSYHIQRIIARVFLRKRFRWRFSCKIITWHDRIPIRETAFIMVNDE